MSAFSKGFLSILFIIYSCHVERVQSVFYENQEVITKPPKRQEFVNYPTLQTLLRPPPAPPVYSEPVLVFESSKRKTRPPQSSPEASLQRMLQRQVASQGQGRQEFEHQGRLRERQLLYNPRQELSGYCQSPIGQFPYPPDCRKFVNCWHGRAMLQVCAPGTLFNAERLECDHPHKARCNQGGGGGHQEWENQQGWRQRQGVEGQGRFNPSGQASGSHRQTHQGVQPRPGGGRSQFGGQLPSPYLAPPTVARPEYPDPPSSHEEFGSHQGRFPARQPQQGTGTAGRHGGQHQQGGWHQQQNRQYPPQSNERVRGGTITNQGGITYTGDQNQGGASFGNQGLVEYHQGQLQTSGSPGFISRPQNVGQPFPSYPPQYSETGGFSGSGSSFQGPYPPINGPVTLVPSTSSSQSQKQSGRQQGGQLVCTEANGHFPHPYDCAQFIQCANYRLWERPCAPGTLFNPRISVCDFPYNVDCQNSRPGAGEEFELSGEQTPPPYPLTNFDIDTRTLPLDLATSNQSSSRSTPTTPRTITTSNSRTHVRPGRGNIPSATTLKPPRTTTFVPDPIPESAEDIEVTTIPDATTPAPTTNTTPIPEVEHPISTPHGGQKVRLRNGPGPWEGLVEIYLGNNLGWGFLCDVSGNWSLNEANVVCHQLGYERGAVLAWQGSRMGHAKSQWPQLSVRCTGEERTLLACSAADVSGMGSCDLARHGAAVRCAKPSRSQCRPHEVGWGGRCYRLTPKMSSWSEAKEQCEQQGANLLVIDSQVENDFVSEWLISAHPAVGKVFTAGVGVKLFNNTMWTWQGSASPFAYAAWWPGWRSGGNARWPVLIDSVPRCVVGSRFYPCPPEKPVALCDLSYLYWEISFCNETGWGVCERDQDDVGCVNPGTRYTGTANVSSSGLHCLPWNSDDPKLVAVSAMQRAELQGHNYCRELTLTSASRGLRGPWCFVAPGFPEACDVPICPRRGEPRSGSYTACKSNDFRCPGGGCVSRDWLCDGERDCPGGEDEDGCDDLLSSFSMRPFSRLPGQDREKYLDTSREKCAKLCLDARSFECKSFSYHSKNRTCVLSATNIGTSGGVETNEAWDLHERRSTAMNCTNLFVCANEKCLPKKVVCNGKDECDDNSDERDCGPGAAKFAIRLAGAGNSTHEGRIEVRAFGRWGMVCDDKFDMLDAHVACRELGFALGASDLAPHSLYAPIFDPANNESALPFLMDEVQCAGAETSLSECPFSGWGEHNCNPEEVAGVVCRVPGLQCDATQFKCSSGECISLNYLCDEYEDCSDGSDEVEQNCKSTLKIRLVEGNNELEGRVEVRYLGVWGTVCDDSFDQPDAQVVCRMLGYWGPAKALKKATFGFGKGPIWLDELACLGQEQSVTECGSVPWGQHNCEHAEDVGVRCSRGNFTLENRHMDPIPTTPAPKPKKTTFFPAQCGEIQLPAPLHPQITPRVIGGVEVRRGEHPWQASLRVRGPNGRSGHWCGAVLISNLHALTAAHCVADHPKPKFLLRVGDHDSQVAEDTEQEVLLDDVIVHPKFNDAGPRLNNDVALLRLKEPGVRFSDFVQPACVVDTTSVYSPELNCTISGWGSKEAELTSGPSRYLRAGAVQLIADATCRSKHVYGPEAISEGMVCAGNLQGGVDSCTGDSGGPLICYHKDRYTLYGLTSWGRGCGASHKPGVYARLSHYRKWIEEVILDLEEESEPMSNQILSLA